MKQGRLGVGLVVALAALAGAGPASASELLSRTVSVASAVDRSCTERRLAAGAGYAQAAAAMPAAGAVSARLSGAGGDWDLAVFDAATGDVIAGSAYAGANELASGFAVAGTRMVVQACRLSGSAERARLDLDFTAIDTSAARPASLVRVSTPTRARKQELVSLGLDLAEGAGPGWIEVVLYGAADAAKLVERNFVYTVQIPDLALQARRDRRADLAFAAANDRSELPSGATSYRRLFDYSEDMKRLAREHPDLVRTFTLPYRTFEGRPVEAIEVAANPNARDGRPVFVQTGAHHAREWPSSEHALEWAYELITSYRRGDPRAQRLVQTTRTVIVPVVNPDGFNQSREAGELFMHGAGSDTDVDDDGEISDPEFILAAALAPNEYKRKNCRIVGDPGAGSCSQPDSGVFGPGVDPNRNYGAFWGGGGSSGNPANQTYRGPEPFSEPETRNIRALVSSRQVTTLITNHTFSNLVLRPPGIAAQGTTVDEEIYRALGDAMAAENGYSSQYGYQLYDTDGTTEDWSYNATGGLGFTFEIGDAGFHPPFEETVKEWNGTSDDATGGGNREAYYIAQESTADASKHSVLAGRAPAGAILRLTKTFDMPTSVEGLTFTDTLDTTMQAGPDGRFEWHVNPSTRPLVAKGGGREATGDPSPPQELESNGPGSTTPCANFDTPPEGCYEDSVIAVPSGAGIDNAKATFRIEFSPLSDWDMKIYAADANGQATGEPVASSGNGATSGALGFEEATVLDPAGSYVVRVINWAAADPWTGTVTFAGPDPYAAPEETWTLLCESPEGVIRSARQVFVARGERRTLDLRADCRTRR